MKRQTPLTREYFDEQLDKKLGLQAKEIKSEIKAHISKEIGDLAGMTAREFNKVHVEFSKVHEGIEQLSGMTAREFSRVHENITRQSVAINQRPLLE